MSNNWQNKMYDHEETPPINAWENIAKQLDAIDKNKPALTITKKSTVIYWRIAAAACILTIITTTAIWLNNDTKKASPNSIASAPSINNSTENKNTEITTIPTDKNIIGIQKDNIVNSTVDTDDIIPELQYAKAEIVKPLASDPTLNKKEKLVGTTGEIINDISLMNAPNSYVSFIGPNGQEVKVSSKFSNLLGYMDGKEPEAEEYLDKVVSESNFWRSKFKNWRNKMINNNIAPSPSNFMDIVELSKLLSEE
ncbi:hypothetical protein ACQ33O_06485 [Ferruginibacter sp. SUN002]|uniref:hypothetical protein n=1 Tax=Ferruginibacter sp. SUN002 TaxID=2937789 RepID=UPI003D367028